MNDDKDFQELEEPDAWDDKDIQVHPPVKSPRAVVSVSFPRDDFSEVSEAARRCGMKTSTFIRTIVLEHVRGKPYSVTTDRTGFITSDFTSGGRHSSNVTIQRVSEDVPETD